ncbi:hypothetical protein CORT_0F03270 [Candida orthopsilosis Co 90-125]|uniref:Vps72/YL1 C-terminal domain-containing protein n=1 Tax=Candida orthopsilosis (strain 90-125) TaxID=1136231 RepID=H8X8S6_CANO9|nr:hypothetical protein CORT_0F03270 [Candida orthopsilosis Co 90-125]CCG24551.1 hypothetical protein CORT_0F03270 [Candida orthopsilosis Co 90-125]
MSDSEDDEVFESLMATRARRANAGSRLKQLIELEGETNEVENSTSQFITEDDENVNLLFQDDEDDQEFVDEEQSDDGSLPEEEDVEEGAITGETTRHPGDEQDEQSEEAQEVNSDEVLSDSDLSASESDESEGEKELQKQERIRKRRKKTVIPQIKKIKEKPSVKRVKKSPLITSDSLLMSSRRASSRSSAVESKQALIDRLKESEERRAKYVPVERKHVRELTQAERLAQAAETEKENIESLNKFKEQEIVKKERQRQSLLSKRVKLQNILRWLSRGTFISPNEEVAEARRQFELYMKKRKRLGKRKKGGEEEVTVIRAPFSIDYDSPYQKALMEEKKKVQQKEKDRLDNMNCVLMEKVIKHESEADTSTKAEIEIADPQKEPVERDDLNTGEDQEKMEIETNVVEEINDEAKTKIEGETEEAKADCKAENESISQNKTFKESEVIEILEEAGEERFNIKKDEKSDAEKEEGLEAEEEAYKETKTEDDFETKADDTESNKEKYTNPTKETEETHALSSAIPKAAENIINEELSSTTDKNSPKRVKFADELNDGESKPFSEKEESGEATAANEMTDVSSIEGTPLPENHINDISNNQMAEEIFEGPSQKVSRNTVYFVDFNEDKRDLKLTPNNVKQILFGEQALWPATRRSNDVKTILRIGKQENPYARKDHKEDDLFTPIADLNEDDPMFDELKKLPRLGVKQDIVEVAENDEENDSAEIVIQTEAPTGLYLPNGNKKVCMVSGTEVKYFDPSTGMPYSSVEVYRTLKLIESGQAEWLGLDATDNGPVDLYLGFKGENARHAKGVPEGF